jgi:hypothetical protein
LAQQFRQVQGLGTQGVLALVGGDGDVGLFFLFPMLMMMGWLVLIVGLIWALSLSIDPDERQSARPPTIDGGRPFDWWRPWAPWTLVSS